jgi:hypothetical protein
MLLKLKQVRCRVSSLNGRQLSSAKMIEAIFVTGIGNVTPTLSATSDGVHKAVKMTLDEPFVILELEAKGKKVKTLVPVTYFSHMVLSEEK